MSSVYIPDTLHPRPAPAALQEIKANPGCTNPACVQRQEEHHAAYNSPEAVAERAAAAAAAAAAEADSGPVHEENEWGIEVGGPAGRPAGKRGSAGQLIAHLGP